MKIKVKEASEAAQGSFDYADAEKDSKKFEFGVLLSNLDRFGTWFERLRKRVNADARVPVIQEAPDFRADSWGASGYVYNIGAYDNPPFRPGLVEFDINCCTNSKKPAFTGRIEVGCKVKGEKIVRGKFFNIKSIDDLTDKLVDDIIAAVKKG